jgi:hypothetical protein
MLFGCGAQPEGVDRQAEWRDVLERKKAAVSAEASPKHKQVYADSVAAFVRRHPDHGRAREVYHRIQVEFAQELSGVGRHQDAIRFYRSVLQRDPRNEEALRGLADAVDRLAVSREKLLQLEKGMSHREVSRILGKPIPGWTVKHQRRNGTYEGWYYRTVAGRVAGVYFRDGKVFAAEESSDAKVGL